MDLRQTFAIACTALALGACGNPPPARLDFATSPGIFRGTYKADLDTRVASSEVVFSPDGKSLIMANGDYFHALQYWDVEKGTPTGLSQEEFFVDSLAMSPDGRRVAAVLPGEAVNVPGSARVWDTASGEVLLQFPASSPDCAQCQARALAISPDGKTLALLSVREYGDNPPTSEVGLYDMQNGKLLTVMVGPAPSPYLSYRDLSFSPDGTRLAAYGLGSYDPSEVAVWDVEVGQLMGIYREETLEGMQTNPHLWQNNAPLLALVGQGQLELKNPMSGESVATLPLPEGDFSLYNLYASEDGKSLIGSSRASIVLWNLSDRSVTAVLTGEGYYAAGFSPDGRYALVWDDVNHALTLRDPDTLGLAQTLVNGEVVPLTFVSEATFINSKSYSVAGTVQFEDEAPLPFEGTVLGEESQVYLAPQFGCICPDPARLQFSFTRGERTWTLFAYADAANGPNWTMGSLDEKSAPAVPARAYTVDLIRQP